MQNVNPGILIRSSPNDALSCVTLYCGCHDERIFLILPHLSCNILDFIKVAAPRTSIKRGENKTLRRGEKQLVIIAYP